MSKSGKKEIKNRTERSRIEWNGKRGRERKAKGSGTSRSMERVPFPPSLSRRRGRRFPDNRSHLCQVVEPEGFPSRHGDEVTIRYFLLLGRQQQQQRGSAVVAIVGERRGMARRKRGEREREKSERSDGGEGRRKRIEASRWRERERGAKEREMEEEEERGRRQVEEEKSVTVLYLSLGPASSFQGSRTPVDRAEFEGRCSSFSGYEPGIPEMT